MEQFSSNDSSFETSNHFYNAHVELEGERTIFVSLEYGRYKFNNLHCFINLQFDHVRCQSDMDTYVGTHIPITLFYVDLRNFDIERFFFFSDCYIIVTLHII